MCCICDTGLYLPDSECKQRPQNVEVPQEPAEAAANRYTVFAEYIHTNSHPYPTTLDGSGSPQEVGARIQYSEGKLTVKPYKHSRNMKKRYTMREGGSRGAQSRIKVRKM